jgi:hypothetical protein
MTAKTIYNGLGTLVVSNTFTDDVSRKGALYRVTDRQGWQTNSYDTLSRLAQ